ncbi:hypothetical protein BGZ67_001782 [Mortierella alpina]|nr:hypothetical protein BGZ67_001782 [Mortierella alpina]
MEPIITSFASVDSIDSTKRGHDEENTHPSSFHYKKINVPLAYPSEAIKEQFGTPKSYVYPPLMSPSDEFFSQPSPTSTSTPQPINIPQGRRNSRSSAAFTSANARSGSLPTMSPINSATTQSQMPSPPISPWKRSNSLSRPTRSATLVLDETPFPDLPPDVRAWTSGHVAEYLGYSLRLYPRAITDDLGRYVRQSACITGAQFIDLTQEDLERMEINLKWRTMILKAVGMLRRETIRASRVDTLNWQDGYDPEKDGALPCPSSSSSSSIHEDHDHEHSHSIHHSASATTESDSTHIQEHSVIVNSNITHSHAGMESIKEVSLAQTESVDAQELRRGIVEDITGVLLTWKNEQEIMAKKAQSSSSSLGFTEGVVIGGLIVAFMMRFSR